MIAVNGKAMVALQTAVEANRQGVESNRQGIERNSELIAVNGKAIAALQTAVETNRQGIERNGALIAALAGDMAVLRKDLLDKIDERFDAAAAHSDIRKGWMIQVGVGFGATVIGGALVFLAALIGG